MQNKLLIVAGEVSGDRHAADLVLALQKRNPDFEFIGIGGDRLQNVGVTLLSHISQLAFLGFIEIIKHIPFIRKVFNKLKGEVRKGIEAAILVDYPGFNLRLARTLKRRGIPVIYYICPQMWAWGEGRVRKFRKYVDLPLVIFQFEREFFEKHGVKSHFVGHPLLDQIPTHVDESGFRKSYQIALDRMIVGLFPGSREKEVERILPIMVEAIIRLRNRLDVQAVVAKTPHLDAQLYQTHLGNLPGLTLIDSDTHRLMKISHVALVASGTATLELAYVGTPSVVLYALSPITYWLGRQVVKIRNIALANIVLGKTVFPEFIQKEANPANVVKALNRLIDDKQHYTEIKKELARTRDILGKSGASDRAADLIIDFLNRRSQASI
jgi:lipid-A-disaccharide synthase